MLNEIPSALKEQVMFNQYGSIIEKQEFFVKITNTQFVWAAVKKITKVSFDNNASIYIDNRIAESMYFIHRGKVKIYAENDFPYATFSRR